MNLSKLEDDERYVSLPIDIDKLNAYLAECVSRGIGYHLNEGAADSDTGKAPDGELSAFPPDYSHIDCSGWVRAAVAYATNGAEGGPVVIPDGSQNQLDWFASSGFKPTIYENTALRDNRLRIAFLRPHDTSEGVGHVWLVLNGKTMESHAPTGPNSRDWNTPILSHCHAAFVVK